MERDISMRIINLSDTKTPNNCNLNKLINISPSARDALCTYKLVHAVHCALPVSSRPVPFIILTQISAHAALFIILTQISADDAHRLLRST